MATTRKTDNNAINVSQCLAQVFDNPRLESAFKDIILNSQINQTASTLLTKYAHVLYSMNDFKLFVTFLRILKSDILVRESLPSVDFFNLTPTTPVSCFNIVVNRLIENASKPHYDRTTDLNSLVVHSHQYNRKTFTRTIKHNKIAEIVSGREHSLTDVCVTIELEKFKILALVALELSQTQMRCVFADLKYGRV